MRITMSEKHNKYDREFREGAVRIVKETKKPVAVIARDLGVNEGTLGNWMASDREATHGTDGLSTGAVEELKRLRREVAELGAASGFSLWAVTRVASTSTTRPGALSGEKRGAAAGCL